MGASKNQHLPSDDVLVQQILKAVKSEKIHSISLLLSLLDQFCELT